MHRTKRSISYYLLSFVIPALFSVIALALVHICPFGDKSITGSDLGEQYLPIMVFKMNMFKSGVLSPFTYQCGFGVSTAALCGAKPSLIDLLFLPFKQELYQELYFVCYVIATGLAGLFSYTFFDRSKVAACDKKIALALSLLYPSSAYFATFSVLIIILGCQILFPLCLLGTEKLIFEKKPWLFIAAYFVCVAESYYFAYISGIFCFIYLIYCFMTAYDSTDIKQMAKSTGLLCLCAAVSAGMAAFCILPAMSAITSGYNTIFNDSPFIPIFQFTPGELCKGLLFIEDKSVQDAGLSVYFGIIPLFAIMLLLLSKAKKRERVTTALICLFCAAALTVKPLYLFMHIGRAPLCFNARFMYAVVFFCLIFASRLDIKKINRHFLYVPPLVITAGCIAALINEMSVRYIINAACVTVLAIAYAVIFARLSDKKSFSKLLCCIIAAEALYSAAGGISVVAGRTGYPQRADYIERLEYSRKLTDILDGLDSGFYRSRDAGGGPMTQMLGGYNSYNFFSSNVNQTASETAGCLGAMVPQGNYISALNGSVLTDSIFGVKYLSGKKTDGKTNGFALYDTVYEDDEMYVSRNPYALPLMFKAEDGVKDCGQSFGDPTAVVNGVFNNQYVFLSSVLNADVPLFTGYDTGEPVLMGCTLEQSANDMTQIMHLTNLPEGRTYAETDEQSGHAKYVFTVPQDGEYCTDTFFDTDISDLSYLGFVYTINGELPQRLMQSEKNAHDMGYFRKGEKITIEITSIRDGFRFLKPSIVRIDTDVLKDAAGMIQDRGPKSISEKDGTVEAAFETDKDTTVFTTIAYDKGLVVSVDGVQTETFRAANAFLAFRLPKGSHDVRITYTTPGLKAGAAVSAVSAVILAAAVILCRKKNKNRE